MFHIIKVRFCIKKECRMGLKHIFGAKDSKEALRKFLKFIEEKSIEPVDIKILTVSDQMEAGGMYEKESQGAVWDD